MITRAIRAATITLTLAFAVFYPMLISIKVFLPLMVGFMGYLLILGIERNRYYFILVSLLYLLNLEVNLSLPLFLTVITVLVFYTAIYPSFDIIKECPVCVSLISVIFIDLLYFIMLIGHDFIFNETSIVVDQLLIYSLLVDLFLVFLL